MLIVLEDTMNKFTKERRSKRTVGEAEVVFGSLALLMIWVSTR